MAIARGTRFGPYEVAALIGAGGMGEVYRAHDTSLKRDVALKVLPERLLTDSNRLALLQREAEVLASLNHANVAQIYGLERSDGRTALVMELIDGSTLAECIAQGPLPPNEAFDIALQIADALAGSTRSGGSFHRDLKPANIKLTSDRRVKVLDFGIAKTVGVHGASNGNVPATTVVGVVVGTPAYMSPEQARGQLVDRRADIWAFGCVLYELLTGQRAFEGDETSAALTERVHGGAVFGRLPAAVPSRIRTALELCLEPDPKERLADIRDVRLVLQGKLAAPATNAAGGLSTKAGRSRKNIASLAVLPLVNVSGDPDVEYLSDGIAESLIYSFSQLPKLRVAQQQKSFRYKGTDVDVQQAASELRVQAILTGKVQLRGDTLVVTMGLVDVDRDAQVWGQQYTKRMADILVLQDEIADEVLQALKLKLAGPPTRQRQTQSTEAYYEYLKGRFYRGKRTNESVRKSLELYQRAQDDPNYALAYAGIADCYVVLGFTPYGAMKPAEAFPRAKIAAQKALNFDSSMAEAYASLGACALLYEWDWAASERAFRQSLEIAPDNVGAHVWYSTLLAVVGKHEKAIAEAQRAAEIDPLSVIAAAHVSLRFYNARRYEDAIVAARKAIEMDPAYPSAHAYLAFAYEASGQPRLAIESAETVASIMRSPHWTAYLGSLYAVGAAGKMPTTSLISSLRVRLVATFLRSRFH